MTDTREQRPRPRRSQPRLMPESVRGWEGHWVALDGEEVVDAAHNVQDLITRLHQSGRENPALVLYVPRPSDVITIGVG